MSTKPFASKWFGVVNNMDGIVFMAFGANLQRACPGGLSPKLTAHTGI